MDNELGLKEKMLSDLASFIGVIAIILSIIFICAGLRLYRAMALVLGFWNEPSLVDALCGGYALFFVAVFIGCTVRWVLVYKWVALGGSDG